MTDIEIRNTVSTDLARLSALDHTIDTDYVWQMDLHRDNGQVSMTLREVRLPRSIRLEHPRLAVDLPDTWHIRPMISAMIGMEAIGYIRFTDVFVPHAVWITDVVVGKPMRGQGIAKKLISAAENWGTQRDLRKAIIEVQSKNAPAIKMIQKLGFEFCGYNDQYYPSRDVAFFFSRSI
ncbi:MAG: GNAT family N-acetyltransferase [Chloroflexota bacterium]